ncbi:MAG: hypothetical protein MAG551_02654 [Candidatus Scalindua arabica]|uniref:Uncharacterized protein n=1 Tax=Candidatus Scalindua arabica TaxID=1127984 RepID=A0A941W653_9BACT|nr:hypothetical protein [Candidatus Scalindua arabica]
MSISLSNTTKKTIQNRLKLKRFNEILGREYQDITPKSDVNREKAKIFSGRFRGSVRLSKGLYYTAREFKEWADKVKRIKMP